ncbi:MAG: DUF2723 domain-containing protein [Chlorobi bacterium]|nr:DUF2723 domain-containing protein [Chlorobiota bacterium]
MRERFWQTWLDTAVVAGVAGVIYRLTAVPDLYYTDCGELAGVCSTLGVAHPTGYPLLTLIGHLWLQLPLPMLPIERLNVLMAVLSALAVAVVHRGVLHLVWAEKGRLGLAGVRSVAAVAAMQFAVARTVWAQALSMEVHALQLLLVAAVFFWLVRWGQQRLPHQLHLAALFLGLGFTNHLTTIVLVPGVLAFVLFQLPGTFWQRLRQLLVPASIVIACGALYAYLPIRSMAEPVFNWGEVHRSVEKFFYHVLGKQYSVWMFQGSARQQLEVFGKLLLPNVAVPIAVWGLWKLWKRARAIALLLVLAMVVCVGYVINYSIHDIEPYFLVAFIAATFATATGIAALWRYRLFRVAMMLLPLVYLAWNWKPNDLHAHHLVRAYVRLVVDPLPNGSILLSQQWDHFCSAFWYLQQVEGYRRDIVLVEKELLRRTWYLKQLERWYGEPIRRCSTEIAAYLPLLEEFESGNMPKERYGIIQQRFVSLLRAFVERNPERFSFATPEVLETEPEFAALYPTAPYGATVALLSPGRPVPPLPKVVDPTLLRQGALHYSTERLDRGLLALAAWAYVRTGDALAARQPTDAIECYRTALALDRTNFAAQERLVRLLHSP